MSGTIPDVRIVVVTYFAESMLGPALEGLTAIAAAGAAECVVVDNASTDGTRDMLAATGDAVEARLSDENLGFGRGCNAGAEGFSGRYVLFLNPDATATPETIRTLVAFMDEHPECGIAAPAIVEPDGELQVFGGRTTPASIIREAFGRRVSGRRPLEPGHAPAEADWVCGAALMIRRELFEAIGGFDPRYFLYFEETDLCRRAQLAGFRIFGVGEAVATHDAGASARASERTLYAGCIAEHYFESRFHYLASHHGTLAAVAAHLLELPVLLARDVASRLRGRPGGRLAARLSGPLFRRPPQRASDDAVAQHAAARATIGTPRGAAP
ncbi:MAG: glycosyltransferase family 2 protein [Phycisphaerales bacterium]